VFGDFLGFFPCLLNVKGKGKRKTKATAKITGPVTKFDAGYFESNFHTEKIQTTILE